MKHETEQRKWINAEPEVIRFYNGTGVLAAYEGERIIAIMELDKVLEKLREKHII